MRSGSAGGWGSCGRGGSVWPDRPGASILALDGWHPDVGHEGLWGLRDGVSGAVVLARSRLGTPERELGPLLEAVRCALAGEQAEEAIPIQGGSPTASSRGARQWRVRSPACRTSCASSPPGVKRPSPSSIEAARPATKELPPHVRGVRPLERARQGRPDGAAEVARSACLAGAGR